MAKSFVGERFVIRKILGQLALRVFLKIGTLGDPHIVLAPDFSRILVVGSKCQFCPSLSVTGSCL